MHTRRIIALILTFFGVFILLSGIPLHIFPCKSVGNYAPNLNLYVVGRWGFCQGLISQRFMIGVIATDFIIFIETVVLALISTYLVYLRLKRADKKAMTVSDTDKPRP